MSLADALNRLSLRVQRRVQGIPGAVSALYELVALRCLRALHEAVAEEAAAAGAERVVDVGCGVADLLSMLARRAGRAHLVGVDISLPMLRRALKCVRERGVEGVVDLVCADAHAAPIRSASVDLVLSIGALHHFRRPERALRECSRVLKESGEAWIYELSHDGEVAEPFRGLRRPKLLLKVAAALHGVPRRELEGGRLGEALMEAGVRFEIEPRGLVTKIVVKSSLINN